MPVNDVRSMDAIRYGAYVCLTVPPDERSAVRSAPIGELTERLGLSNEFQTQDGHPAEAVAFLRRVEATNADIEDEGLFHAEAVVHVASARPEPVAQFCEELRGLLMLTPTVKPYIMRGVLRPSKYTGNAMHNFAYARQVLQQPGELMPNAFLMPMNKVADWWEKGWMERHTYFLPRYDDSGRMLNDGHALVAKPGIECILRRTYKNMHEPAPAGSYDFINYFECADEHVERYHAVLSALRDVSRNPEWKFVREGPLWHGRRVATWSELFA